MPRRARLSLARVPWHILQRGDNRSVCFHGEQDYQFYPHYLKELAEKFGCAVHAYVLMTNHGHLLLTPTRKDSAGMLMKHLGLCIPGLETILCSANSQITRIEQHG